MVTKIEKKHLEGIFSMRQTGSKGWHYTDCPFCKKTGHMGINFTGIGSFNCFKCGEHGTIFKLLKHIGRYDIVREAKTVHINEALINKTLIEDEENFQYERMKKCSTPLGFTKIYDNEYIEGDRGIDSFVFEVHSVGYSRIETKLKNYVIFLLYYENELVGWIGRSTLSGEQIKQIEDRTGKRYLRYVNSPGTDFSKYLFGINEIKQATETVILVEGIFDKLKVDTLLHLYECDEIKCLACFGKKVSKNQLYLLQLYNIKTVIIIYDSDALSEAKRYGIELNNYFNVLMGFCKSKDPGDMEFDELSSLLNDLSNPIDFLLSKVTKNKLK